MLQKKTGQVNYSALCLSHAKQKVERRQKEETKMKVQITYNKGFGKMTAEEENGVLYIHRAQYVRAWQRLTDPRKGFDVNTKVEFDTDKKVLQRG